MKNISSSTLGIAKCFMIPQSLLAQKSITRAVEIEKSIYELKMLLRQNSEDEIIEYVKQSPYSIDTICNYVKAYGKLPE